MNLRTHRPPASRYLVIAGGFLLLLGGCAVDTDALATDVVQAALQSIADSLVDSLSAYLAGN